MRSLALAVALASFVLSACSSGGPATHVPSAAAPTPLTTPSAPDATELESSTTSPAPRAAIVGSWVGVHDCDRIMTLMTEAGMPAQGLLNIVDARVLPGVTTIAEIADRADPCAGAVAVEHSHFFTAAGVFGSRDETGQQVDDGSWTLVDEDTIAINGVPFDFVVDGEALELTPVDVARCPDNGEWCQEAWKLMVAMPGMQWIRATWPVEVTRN